MATREAVAYPLPRRDGGGLGMTRARAAIPSRNKKPILVRVGSLRVSYRCPSKEREQPMNKDFERPPADLITDLYQVSSATATGTLSGLGIRDAYLQGPIARTPGTKVVGPAITLQFLPKREDQTTGLGAGRRSSAARSGPCWSTCSRAT